MQKTYKGCLIFKMPPVTLEENLKQKIIGIH